MSSCQVQDIHEQEAVEVYENFCIIGALLSKSEQDDTWTIWNTNPTETGYWDPKSDTITTPSTQYGEVVAVCVGRGLWAKIGWSGLTETYAPRKCLLGGKGTENSDGTSQDHE